MMFEDLTFWKKNPVTVVFLRNILKSTNFVLRRKIGFWGDWEIYFVIRTHFKIKICKDYDPKEMPPRMYKSYDLNMSKVTPLYNSSIKGLKRVKSNQKVNLQRHS